jgi:hypothetical protein
MISQTEKQILVLVSTKYTNERKQKWASTNMKNRIEKASDSLTTKLNTTNISKCEQS